MFIIGSCAECRFVPILIDKWNNVSLERVLTEQSVAFSFGSANCFESDQLSRADMVVMLDRSYFCVICNLTVTKKCLFW